MDGEKSVRFNVTLADVGNIKCSTQFSQTRSHCQLPSHSLKTDIKESGEKCALTERISILIFNEGAC